MQKQSCRDQDRCWHRAYLVIGIGNWQYWQYLYCESVSQKI